MQTQNITLDFCLNDYKTVTVKQGDKDSRNLIITCTDNGSVYKLNSSTQECNVKMNTPDNRAIFNTATINSDGTISMTFTESMVYASGTGKLEIQIIEQSTKRTLSTMILTVLIVGNVYPDNKVIVSDEFSALTKALLSINDSINEAEKAIDRIEVLESTVERAEVNRINAESERQSNEENRQVNTATAISNAEEATAAANTATTNANNATETANTATDNAIEATSNAVSATANANEATENAIDATQDTIQATNDIRSLEEQVTAAETLRQEQEAIRQENEEKRQTDTTTAINNANTATVRANEAANAAEAALDKKADAIVQTLSGTALVAVDSAKAGLHGLRVFGKTEQETTTGKNLLENTAVTNTVKGVTFTVNEDGSVTVNGTATAVALFIVGKVSLISGTAYICDSSVSNIGFSLRTDNGSTVIHDFSASSEYTANEDIECEVCIRVASDVTVNTTVYPMLRLATIEDDTYEPYTGGIASPNPQYPQELVSVGDEGSVEVGVYGGNLLDFNKIPTTAKGGATLTNNGDGSFTISGSGVLTEEFNTYYEISNAEAKRLFDNGLLYLQANTTSVPYFGIQARKADGSFSSILLSNNNNASGNVELTQYLDGGSSFRFIIYSSAGKTITPCTVYPMFYAHGDGTFTPYTKQSLITPVGDGLPGIKVTDATLATYTDADGQMWCADEVDFERGVYVQRVVKSLLSQNNYVDIGTSNSIFNVFYFSTGISYDTKVYTERNIVTISNKFVYGNKKIGRCEPKTVADSSWSGNCRFIVYVDKTITNITELLEVIGDDCYAYVPLATPIETPLTDEELAAYAALHSNYPITSIISDAHTEVDYVTDTKTYIDNKFAELAAAIVAGSEV